MNRRRKFLGGSVLVLLLLLGVVLVSTGGGRSFGGRLNEAQRARAEKSGHYEAGRFVNLVPTLNLAEGRAWDSVTRFFTVEAVRTAPAPMPTVQLTAQDFGKAPSSGLEVVWLGHATTLLEVEGMRVMLDPMLSKRASPLSWVGPTRYHTAPLGLEALPKVDVAMVSHDHYDHLDMATVEALASQGTVFVVPLGIGAHLSAWGVPAAQRVELDWWESHVLGGLTITCVPSRHYSGRGLGDQDATLWSGWVVKGAAKSFYYSGDTGFGEHFASIGARLGPFDLSLIKIGEYDETWPEIHINPEEAVQAQLAVQGRLLLPVHWGTFNLAYHGWDEPIRRLVKAAEAAGVQVTTPRPGERVVVGGEVPSVHWWEAVK